MGVPTIEFKVSFFGPARLGGTYYFEGRVLKLGRTLTVARAEVWMRLEDGSETLCAAMQATLVPSLTQ